MSEQVILVDEQDRAIGTAEKLSAHQQGQLHRAFSVFIYRRPKNNEQKVEWLLQQRQIEKYHCGGLWTNSCCSHPRPNETLLQAAIRRVFEELRLRVSVQTVGHFIYRAAFDNGLVEHEFDHVLIGECNTHTIDFNPAEVQAYRWMNTDAIIAEYQANPSHFTPWFMLAFQKILDNIALQQELNIC
jgi:isopentenyl-diphosphate delta-isomerase type 1